MAQPHVFPLYGLQIIHCSGLTAIGFPSRSPHMLASHRYMGPAPCVRAPQTNATRLNTSETQFPTNAQAGGLPPKQERGERKECNARFIELSLEFPVCGVDFPSRSEYELMRFMNQETLM